MKVILYMAQTVNGFIAKLDNTTPWSDEEWEMYKEKVRKAGNIIIGRKTYEIMKDDGFDTIGNPFVIVVSQQNFPNTENVVFVKTPQEALKIAEEKGFQEVLVTGGSQINGLFLKEQLVDELFIDVEPLLLGQGIPLFTSQEMETKLEFLGINPISKNSFQVHYKIVR